MYSKSFLFCLNGILAEFSPLTSFNEHNSKIQDVINLHVVKSNLSEEFISWNYIGNKYKIPYMWNYHSKSYDLNTLLLNSTESSLWIPSLPSIFSLFIFGHCNFNSFNFSLLMNSFIKLSPAIIPKWNCSYYFVFFDSVILVNLTKGFWNACLYRK